MSNVNEYHLWVMVKRRRGGRWSRYGLLHIGKSEGPCFNVRCSRTGDRLSILPVGCGDVVQFAVVFRRLPLLWDFLAEPTQSCCGLAKKLTSHLRSDRLGRSAWSGRSRSPCFYLTALQVHVEGSSAVTNSLFTTRLQGILAADMTSRRQTR